MLGEGGSESPPRGRARRLFEKNGYTTATSRPLDDWKAKGFKTEAPKPAPPGPVKPD